MRVLVTGATGFVGGSVCEALKKASHQVVALSRDAASARKRVSALDAAHSWDPLAGPPPGEAFSGIDGVVHLAGESVVGRWTEAKKAAIRDSRVAGSANLVKGLAQAEPKPRVLVAASAIGYYGDRGDEELTENSAPGDDFLARTCQEWEAASRKAEDLGVRVATLRTGIVLGEGGGALQAMLTPFKLGAGGPLGSGSQWWSWIHRRDVIGLILFALQNPCQGPINATAPNPLRQKDFAKVLGKVLHRPAFMPAPAFALRLVLGGFSAELLSSKRVLPRLAREIGYSFQFGELDPALRDVLS